MKAVGLRGLATVPTADSVDAKVARIQALIPLGLKAIAEALEEEVTALAGEGYSRTSGRPGVVRWCRQQRSVYLADQTLPIPYQRVRDQAQHTEEPRAADAGLFRKVLLGLRCRHSEACAEAVPPAFWLNPSTVSRRFIRASGRQFRVRFERRRQRGTISRPSSSTGRPSRRMRWSSP